MHQTVSLMISVNCFARKDLLKLRTSNHSLLVESERHSNPKLPHEDRIYHYCHQNEIEDGQSLLESQRNIFLKN